MVTVVLFTDPSMTSDNMLMKALKISRDEIREMCYVCVRTNLYRWIEIIYDHTVYLILVQGR